jgi:hypothetical protein
MGCPSCGRGFHEECYNDDCRNCHSNEEQRLIKSVTATGSVGAPIKDPESVKDRHSTGRKRAAMQYPIFKDQPCEWQRQKNCGGGTPIVGCVNGMQIDRHHGPVKDTLRNEPGNVHRICKHCHNRWHAVNDPIYDEEEYNKLPHSPEEATELELLANEAYWRIKK